MTHIAEATTVHAPPERSRRFLIEYVKGLQAAQQGRAILRLRAGTTPGGLHLERDVEAELTAGATDPLEYRVNISWAPSGTALIPSFKGIVRFQWDEEYGNTWLVIEGDYEPPLGAAGKAFDAMVGQRIARGTLRALLDDFRTAIETAQAADARKTSP